MKYKLAMLGAGRMGAVHGPHAAAHPALSVAYVVEPNAELAEPMAARLGAKIVSLEHALGDPEIAGVIVASSTDMHLSHSLACMDAGKAVFCEKPIDLDLEKARAAASRFKNAPFVLGFNRRFDPHFQALKAKLDGGAVGALESIHIVNHDPASPPAAFVPRSGGLFKDFTIHDLDLARWLLGEEPASVFATASVLVDPEIARMGDVDTARVILRTKGGQLCMISNTRRSGLGYDQRVEAFGARGMVNVGNVTQDNVAVWNESGLTASPVPYNFMARYSQSYKREIDHFADVLAGRAKPSVGYEDGLKALTLAEACARSARANAPVMLEAA